MELACHRIPASPGKSKGVLYSQEDGTNIFPSQLNNMSNLCAFHCEHPLISENSQVSKQKLTIFNKEIFK